MRGTMDSLKIESNILRDLADFDTSAPINTTIWFDSDSDEQTDKSFKTKNLTDYDTRQIAMMPNQLDVTDLKVKKEITEEPIESSKAITETNFDKPIQQNVIKECHTHQADHLHNKILTTDDSRKRKQKQLHIYKNIKAAKMSAKINSSSNFWPQNNFNKDKSKVSTPTSDPVLESNQGFKIVPQNSPHPKYTAGLSDTHVLLQSNVDSQTRTEASLSSVSEHMRQIIEAYYNQKQNPNFKDNYKRIKNKLFSLSFNIVVEKLLPEETNTQFIKDFVKATHHRVSENSSYKCFYQDYETLLRELMDWAKNKMPQTKKTADISDEQPNLSGKKIDQKVDEQSVQNNDVKLNNSFKSRDAESICIFSLGSPGKEITINFDPSLPPTAKEKSKRDQQQLENLQNNIGTPAKIHDSKRKRVKKAQSVKRPTASPLLNLPAIFFQSPHNPESEEMQQSLEEMMKNNDTPPQPLPSWLLQIQKSLDIQHVQQPPVQSQLGQSTNVPTEYVQSSPVPPSNSQSANLQQQPRQSQSMQQQYRDPPPYSQHTNLRQQLRQSQVQQQQHREHGTTRTQYEQLQHVHLHHGQLQPVQPQLGQPPHATQQHSQSDRIQSQYGPLQHMQRYYGQCQSILPQYGHSNDMQQQVVQSQREPLQYAQSHHLPPQNGQPKSVQSQYVPQYGPYARPNVGKSQSLWTHYEHSLHNQPQNGQMKPGPPQIRQLQPVRPHYQQSHNLLPQHELSKYFQPQTGQSQTVLPSYNQTDCLKSLLEKPHRLEWHQELDSLYNQEPMQYHHQKSSPRSASTDSGFISPLNFNVSADQTIGTPDCAKAKERAPVWEPPSEESETPSLLITHVTSLNPEVSFIEEGNCVICKKPTKQMCMGCMKYYYCTYECQLQDWSSHEPDCKKNNNS